MVDLNVMLLEHARSGIQAKLDTAVTNGDTEAARKAADELAKLTSATAPRAPAYGDAEIRAELDKLDWFGTDPKKSARVIELGKTLNPKKFGTPAEFAAALVKAVEAETAPPPKPGEETGGEDDEETGGEDDEETKPPPKKQRASDAPAGDDTGASRSRRSTAKWAKISDAPSEVQKEINRTADKFAPKTKEGRQAYIDKALNAQWDQHQRKAGKK